MSYPVKDLWRHGRDSADAASISRRGSRILIFALWCSFLLLNQLAHLQWSFQLVAGVCYTHISLMSHFWDRGKQCRHRLDATECSIWSGSSPFANRNIYSKYNKTEEVHQTPKNLENGLIQLIRMDGSIRQIWFKMIFNMTVLIRMTDSFINMFASLCCALMPSMVWPQLYNYQ